MTSNIIPFPVRNPKGGHVAEAGTAAALDPDTGWIESLFRGLEAHEEGRPDQAQALLRASLENAERHGPSNYRVAISLGWLAEAALAAGRYADARPLIERALAINRKLFGPTHVEVAHNLNNLGVIHQTAGEHGQAVPLFRAAFAIHQTALGQADIETCRSLRNLGLAYRDMKDTRRAVRAFTRILDALGDAGTADALFAAEIHDDRGIVHLGDDALAEAQADFEAAYEIRLRAAGPDSVEIVSSLICHALLRTRQRAWARARALYEAGLEILDRHPGQVEAERTLCLENLALLRRAGGEEQGRTRQTQSLMTRAAALAARALGANRPLSATS